MHSPAQGFLAAFFLLSIRTFAAGDATPAGHWEGAIKLPGADLIIQVDLKSDADGKWTGTIDIPAQGLREFKLGDISVTGAAVTFAMPGIPGDPLFKGRHAADGKTLEGEFTQAAMSAGFQLERKPKPAATNESPGIPGKGLAGEWQGALKVQLFELRLLLHIKRGAGGKLSGTMDSIDQGATGLPITKLSERNGKVHLELKSIGGIFYGEFNADGSQIAGLWKQNLQTFPLVFRRLEKAPVTARPQEPKKPYPYDEKEVVFQNRPAGVKLAGTLTVPRGPGPHPAVVLITGSGPQDRDESVMGHRPFLVLADHLTRNGIAVLRHDDRGFGKSTGDFGKATDDDFVDDALAAVAFLKTRKEIDPKRIGLIGHSEGGVIAPLAAIKSSDVSFIVLMAAPGVSMEELLFRQGMDIARASGVGEEIIKRNTAVQREIFLLLKEQKPDESIGKKIRELAKEQMAALSEEQRHALGLSDAMVENQIEMITTPWFRKLLAYDPRPTFEQVKCPVLAINGEKDIQVAAKENLAAIEGALTTGGNKKFKIVELPGLNHLFQTCQSGAVTEYSRIDETFAPAALEVISGWIKENAGQ